MIRAAVAVILLYAFALPVAAQDKGPQELTTEQYVEFTRWHCERDRLDVCVAQHYAERGVTLERVGFCSCFVTELTTRSPARVLMEMIRHPDALRSRPAYADLSRAHLFEIYTSALQRYLTARSQSVRTCAARLTVHGSDMLRYAELNLPCGRL